MLSNLPLSRRWLVAATVAAVGVLAGALGHGSGEQPLSVGTEWQLFIDDYVVASTVGLTRIMHAPERRPAPILEGTEPWEKWTIELNGRSVLYDPEARQFKMWYLAPLNDRQAHRGVQYKVCYAVSSDGIRWIRPELGLVEWEGSRQNNILPWGEHWMRRPNVMMDPDDPDPSRRFKMLYTDVVGGKAGVNKAFSSDGIHWRLNVDRSPWYQDDGNGANLLGWDPRARRYVVFLRKGEQGTLSFGGIQRTWISRATSTDFLSWTDPEKVLEVGDSDAGKLFRGLAALPYRDLYLGLLWVFYRPGPTQAGQPARSSIAESELALSRDGVVWKRVAPGHYFFGRGLGNSWDRELVLPLAPIVHADRIWIYYTGFNLPYGLQAKDRAQEGWVENGERKQRAIGLATLRLDGFASLQAGRSGGEIRTRLLDLTGDTLEVNSAVRGELRVEVQDRDGRAVPGFEAAGCDPIRSDGLRMPVRWRGTGDLSRLRGRPVRLRFVLKDADLYAFAFRSSRNAN